MKQISKWKISKVNEQIVNQLSKELNISVLTARLLVLRGIQSIDEARSFLQPDIKTLHDPFLMKDMEKAVNRIVEAKTKNQRILIYGDYDVDGTTSSSILFNFLSSIGCIVEVYIPDRFEEGYGLSETSIKNFKSGNYDLVITVDCGIASLKEIEIMKELGMDVIVTDHHHCQNELPKALAVVNPHREDCNYPFKNLAGVGVTYKLISALAKTFNITGIEKKYLEIVALGTIADIVELVNENRVFVSYGLKLMQNSNTPGINALIDVCGLKDKEINSFSIAFGLAPRINAAGRMGKALRSVKLLTSSSLEEALGYARELNDENLSRQETEAGILEQVYDYIENNHDFEKDKVIVAVGDNWHHGVIGIVASKVVERYYRPCVLLSYEDGLYKGSARSIDGYNIFEALFNCQELMEKYGGHELAAGLTISKDNLEALKRALNEYADKVLLEGDLEQKLYIDAFVDETELNIKTVNEIRALAPFGQGNPSPLFACTDLKIENVRTMTENKHIKFVVQKGSTTVDAVGFGLGHLKDSVRQGDIVEMACSLDINSWNNVDKVQIMIRDFRFNEQNIFNTNYYNTLDSTICYEESFSEKKDAYDDINIDNFVNLIEESISIGKKVYILVNSIKSFNDIRTILVNLNYEDNTRICFERPILERNTLIYIVINPNLKKFPLLENNNVVLFGEWADNIYFETLLNSIDKKCLFLYNIIIGLKDEHDLLLTRERVGIVYKYLKAQYLKNKIELDCLELATMINSDRINVNLFIIKKSLEVLNELRLLTVDFVNENKFNIKEFDDTGKKVSLEASSIYRKLHSLRASY